MIHFLSSLFSHTTGAMCDFPSPVYLFFSSNVPQLVYYSHLPIAILSLVIGLFIFLSNRKALTNRLLFGLTIFFSLWVILDSVFWASNRGDVVMFVWSLQILFEPLVYICALYLSYVLLYKKDLPFGFKVLVGIIYLPIVVFVPTSQSLLAFNLNTCLSVEGPIAFYTYIAEVAYTIGIILIVIRRLHQEHVRKNRQEIIFVGGGLLLLLLSFSLGNIVSSFTENWNYAQIGLFMMPVFIGFLAYSIIRFGILNTKLISSQALIAGVWFLVFALLFIDGKQNIMIVTTITLLFISIIGYVLIKTVRREVSQRERLEQLSKNLEVSNLQLSDANDKLKSLDKLKTEFLSLASHQLRSPLTAIKGYASMLSEGAFGPLQEKQDEAVKRVYASAQGLVNVVEDLLNVSKIEQGGMKYEFIPTDVRKLVLDLVNEMKIPAENKHLEFKADIPEHDAFMVTADPTKLKQVFLNLVDNSIKYTKSGFVRVSLTRDTNKKTVTFSVQDSGIGITEETKERLFQKFSRGEGGKLNTGGSGLGLYLAREIARAHKGDISIESDGTSGATFSVSLPASGAHTHDFIIPS